LAEANAVNISFDYSITTFFTKTASVARACMGFMAFGKPLRSISVLEEAGLPLETI